MISIRIAEDKDFSVLPDIEMDAGYELIQFGLQAVANMPAAPVEFYNDLPDDSAVFVACDESTVIGFVLCQCIDGEGHLKEISVLRQYMRKGIGKQLIRTSIDWAITKRYQFLTLTTYRDIPFNAPFYEALGFSAFEPDKKWPGLCLIREVETSNGLDIKPRISMKLSLSSNI